MNTSEGPTVPTVPTVPIVPMYETIGGELKVRQLVDQFYDLMELEPEFIGIRALHPASLEG
jgi:hemoglobin